MRCIIDDLAKAGPKVGVKYHLELNENIVLNSRHTALYAIDTSTTGLIQTVYDVVEPSNKTGQLDLAILSVASKFIGTDDANNVERTTSSSNHVVSKNKAENVGWLNSFLNGGSSTTIKSSMLTPPKQYLGGKASIILYLP